MSTRAHVAKVVRELKDRHPELYCRLCLYRLVPGELGFEEGLCPRHTTHRETIRRSSDHPA